MTPAQHNPHPPAPALPGDRSVGEAAHFLFGIHDEHGFVASFTSGIPAHIGAWYLTREQFEPVPDTPGLFRLVEPDRDGVRRARQAVKDLRRVGYQVRAEHALEPAGSGTSGQALVEERSRYRTRLAQAAAGRSPQIAAARAVPVAATRPLPAQSSHRPVIEPATPAARRNR